MAELELTQIQKDILYALITHNWLTPLWALGVYVWLTGILTLVLAGSMEEHYSWGTMAKLAVFLLPMMYFTAIVHAQGTLRALVGRGRGWVVTPKRGRYEHLYGREGH